MEGGGFSLKAFNERDGIPANRFEWFTVVLGKGSEQHEYLFSAEEGIVQNSIVFDTKTNKAMALHSLKKYSEAEYLPLIR